MRDERVFLVLLLSFVVLISATCGNKVSTLTVVQAPPERILSRTAVVSYTLHDPVVIANDSDFVAQGWPGNGTAEDPYRIENLEIHAQSSIAIKIVDTRSHFVIRNCYIKYDASYGIYVNNATNGRITDCIVSDRVCAIYIENSTDFVVESNVVSNIDLYGIRVPSSERVTIRNNTIYECHYDGIRIQNGVDIGVLNNTISALGHGIDLRTSDNCTVDGNALDGCSVAIFSDNASQWYHNITVDNTVNGKPIGYFVEEYNTSIDAHVYGQVILANCSEVTVFNASIHDVSTAIEFGHCSNCVIRDSMVNHTCCLLYTSPSPRD